MDVPRVGRGLRSTVVEFGSLNKEVLRRWACLCTSENHLRSPFFSPSFSAAVAESADVRVGVLIVGDRIVGFCPFQFPGPHFRSLRAAEAVGRQFNSAVGIVAEAGTRITSSEFLRLCGLSYFYFTDLDERQLAYGFK